MEERKPAWLGMSKKSKRHSQHGMILKELESPFLFHSEPMTTHL